MRLFEQEELLAGRRGVEVQVAVTWRERSGEGARVSRPRAEPGGLEGRGAESKGIRIEVSKCLSPTL